MATIKGELSRTQVHRADPAGASGRAVPSVFSNPFFKPTALMRTGWSADRKRIAPHAGGLIAALMLGACSQAGDLGRPRYGWVDEAFASATSGDPQVVGAVSAFPMTDEEIHLRKLADQLLVPPDAEPRWFFVALGGNRTGPIPAVFDRAAYTDVLLGQYFRSVTSRYARLIDDIRNNILRIEPFFAAARRVADLDQKRRISLKHVTQLSGGEAGNADLRIRENIGVVASVHEMLHVRVGAYRFALERLVVALPSPMAVETERVWIEFERRVSEIRLFAGSDAITPVAYRGTRTVAVGPVSK